MGSSKTTKSIDSNRLRWHSLRQILREDGELQRLAEICSSSDWQRTSSTQTSISTLLSRAPLPNLRLEKISDASSKNVPSDAKDFG